MTKSFFIVPAAAIFLFSACSGKLKESQVPAAAKEAFEKKYGDIKSTWDKEDNNYEVNFKKDGKEMSVVIDENGTIVETETDIPVTDLPATVQEYIKQHYQGKVIKEASTITKANGEVNYEAEVDDKDVIFDANGKFIEEEKD
jgi:putative PepSY-like beta-lactamase-inhibitor